MYIYKSWKSVIIALGLTACSAESRPRPLTYDEFKALASYEPNFERYVVDGDELVVGEAALREEYAAYFDSFSDTTAHGYSVSRQGLIVRRIDGQDVKWGHATAANLTYCVSKGSFGSRYEEVVSAMDTAATEWEEVADVNFVHVAANDDDCSSRTASVIFNVREGDRNSTCTGTGCENALDLALGFNPSQARSDRELRIFQFPSGPITLTGLLRHELGHTLGFRHEHIRPQAHPSGECADEDRVTHETHEDPSEWGALTAYDSASVMHYSQCNGTNHGDWVLTELDKIGAGVLYPRPFIPPSDFEEKLDLNADGKADVCGRAGNGISCALSTGTGFASPALWTANFSDANGWTAREYYSTIHFPDVNGDGKADVCGRAPDGLYCAVNTGASFGQFHRWAAIFTNADGWTVPEYYSTIRFPDVNGDGKADTCGRAVGGVYCALSNGTSFAPAPPNAWATVFSDVNGWSSPEYYSTIRFPDVNGDGRADVCGRGGSGVYCGLSNGATFVNVNQWTVSYSDAAGWNSGPEYYSTIRFPDVNGDHKADICGRGVGGIYCAMSTGTSFVHPEPWASAAPDFGDSSEWDTSPAYYSTIQFADLNGDQRADVCGRGQAGLYCALSTGTTFASFGLWTTSFSNALGWHLGPEYYSTIRLADVTGDGRADVCGRGGDGITCVPSLGTTFGTSGLWTSSFSDVFGWNLGPEYYSTIRLP